MLVRHPWKTGPHAAVAGPVVVSATRFHYRRWRTMPLVAWHALRLRRGWPRRDGAVALCTGGETSGPVSLSLSVWRSEDDLRRFLASPEHRGLVRGYRSRLVGSRSVVFELERFDRDRAWTEGVARLAKETREPQPAAG